MSVFSGWHITRTGIVFILGIIILAGLVFGGVLLVRDRGEQARRQEAVKIAEQNLESQSQTDTKTQTTEGDATSKPTVAVTDTHEEATSAAPETSATLPETGIDGGQIVIVTILALAGSYYLTSRRALRRL